MREYVDSSDEAGQEAINDKNENVPFVSSDVESQSLDEQAGVKLNIHQTATKKELITYDENLERDRNIEI